MKRVVILEDSPLATIELERILKKFHNTIIIEKVLSSVNDSVAWFQANKEPDVIFSGIVLNDGKSFDVFKKVKVSCPILFYTTGNQYIDEGDKNNKVNDLIKLKRASPLEMFLTELENARPLNTTIDNIYRDMQRLVKRYDGFYQSTILCHSKDQIIPLATDSIKYISNKNRLTNAYTKDRSYIINKTLDQLMSRLNPYKFFHANRNYIIHRNAIQIITKQPGRKLDIKLALPDSPVISISKDKATEFKKWLEGYIPWT